MDNRAAIQMKTEPLERNCGNRAGIRRMTPPRLFPFVVAVFVALAATSLGQGEKGLNLRAFKLADGLAESACMSVTVEPQGQVLVRHAGMVGVSELDGYTINILPSPGEGNSRIYGSPAGQLWTVSRLGLEELKEGEWVVHPVPEIAAEFRTGMPRVLDPVPLFPVKQGQVLCLLAERLLEFDSEGSEKPGTHLLRLADQTRLERFHGMAPARDGGLWIAGAAGLAKVPGPLRNLKAETQWQEYLPPAMLQIRNLQEPHEGDNGGVTMVAESATSHQKVLAHFDGAQWTTEAAGTEKIRQAWRGVDKTYWASTIDSLQLWTEGRRETIENEDISARQFFDVAVEPGGVFWIATSDGLLRFAPLTWRTPASAREVGSLVSCLTADESGRIWFVSSTALHSLMDEQHQEYPLPARLGSDGQAVRALFPLKNGMLVLKTEDQMQVFRPGSGRFSPVGEEDAAHPVKSLGTLRDGSLAVQRFNSGGAEQAYRLETYNGVRFAPFLEVPSDPLLGAGLHTLFSAQNGDFWLSSERGIAWYHEGKWRTFISAAGSSPEGALWFAEPADGKIWCASRASIWEFDGKRWVVVRTGFDRINDLLRTHDGSLWVASNSGLNRFWQGAWVENSREEGLPATAVREVCEDARGRIWAGTTHGLSLYHPEADTDPPRTFIHELTVRETNVPEGGTITLAFGGQDKWNYTRRQRLLYSHRLDGRDWSPFEPANNIAFIDLPAGKHYFDVRAMDRNGNVDPNPARLEFAVILPWYKESRLVLILLAGLAAALFFAGLAFNRHRQLVRSYAEVEKKVADRTRELDIANRALTHSQKMNALGTLAAGIAHDFNNILSIIKGSAQLIEENVDNPQKIATRVDRIKTVVEQGAGIVKAMLGFSSESDQQPGPCDVNEVVAETLKLLGDRFLHEVQISFERGPDLPALTCSKDFIQQIVLNFVFNAAESMAKQKRIVLATRLLDKEPADPVLAPTAAPSYIAVSVKDFGCGIPPENMPRIFEPFFTTKALSVRRGTGLGLSMVYELAKRMGAGLAVASVVEQGSVFTLILPVNGLSPGQQKLEL
jgi:signal transduction histidine kinase